MELSTCVAVVTGSKRIAYCVPMNKSDIPSRHHKSLKRNGRDAGIRTRDPLTPSQVR